MNPERQAEYVMTTNEVAALLRVSVRTLEFWRTNGMGPPFLKYPRKVVYLAAAVRQWAENQVHSSTSQYQKGHSPR